MNPLTFTNTTKGQLLALVNVTLALMRAFGLDLSDGQMNALTAFINVAFGVYLGTTYKLSPTRMPTS